MKINLTEVVGKGYGTIWNFKGRYRVIKGSRASKKSKTLALNYIVRLMQYDKANLLVVRKTERTLRNSVFTELLWAINRLGVENEWSYTVSPLELTYKPTGQKIYFRGFDDPLKLTSITVKHGYLCWAWIEEAYELNSESDFDMLDESIRGATPGLFKQLTLSLNPWNERHWIKSRFFDNTVPVSTQLSDDGVTPYLIINKSTDGEILASTTNYLCNEFLDSADLKVFESMKVRNPRRYQVAGLGNWGIIDGLIYDNWIEQEFDINVINKRENIKSIFGLDFGYTNDPTAFVAGLVDNELKEIYIFDEMYKHGLTNRQIYNELRNMGYAKEDIRADNEPKSIDELRMLGLSRIRRARKGPDSVLHGIQKVQDYKIIIHPRCVNFLTEISNYQWDKDKYDKPINKPVTDLDHLMDALRYAMETITVGNLYEF